MSSKFKKQQQRRRWSEAGTVFPEGFIGQLESLQRDASWPPSVQAVAHEIQRVAGLQSTYGELEDLKSVVLTAEKAVNDDVAGAHACFSLLVQLLLLENSKPLHRQVLAFMRKLSPPQQVILGQVVVVTIKEVLVGLSPPGCDTARSQEVTSSTQQHEGPGGDGEIGALAPQQGSSTQQRGLGAEAMEAGSSEATAKVPQLLSNLRTGPVICGSPWVLGQALSSLLGLPSGRHWIRSVSTPCLRVLSSALSSLLVESTHGPQLTPTLMDQVQDTISTCYYLVTYCGEDMAQTEEGVLAMVACARVMISALQGEVLVREAMASAAVLIWAVAAQPGVAPDVSARMFAEGLFFSPGGSGQEAIPSLVGSQVADEVSGFLDTHLRRGGSSLAAEMQHFSALGRVCALKGLLTVMPQAVLCCEMKTWGENGVEGKALGASLWTEPSTWPARWWSQPLMPTSSSMPCV